MCKTIRNSREANGSSRHASRRCTLQSRPKNKKAFKRMRSRIKRRHDASIKRIGGWKVKIHSFNYGGLGKLLKRAVSVEVGSDEGDLILNVPEA